MSAKRKTPERTVGLADIARRAHVAPKTARSYARRHKSELPRTVGKRGWRFRVTDQTTVKRILVNGV